MTQALGAVSFDDHVATVVNPDPEYDATATIVETHLLLELPAFKWYVPMRADVPSALAPLGNDPQDPKFIARMKHSMPIIVVLIVHGQVLSMVLGLDLRLYHKYGIAKALNHIIHKALTVLIHGFPAIEGEDEE